MAPHAGNGSDAAPKKRGRLRENLTRFRHLGTMAASGLGLTGAKAPTGPLYAQFSICDPCNHKCVMCWDHPPDDRGSFWTEERFGGERPGVLPLETFTGIVDDLHRMGTRKIEMVGRGEPLLNKAAVDMVEYAKRLGFYVSMTSNGSKLDEEKAERLVAAGLDHLHISLNAGRPETYPKIHVTESPENYRKVKDNLRRLAEIKARAGVGSPHTRTSNVISSRNWQELTQMIEVASEVGAEEASFYHVVPHGGTQDLALGRDQYDELQRSIPAASERAAELGVNHNLETLSSTPPTYLREVMTGEPVVPCYVGWWFTVILGNGKVSPCCQCSKTIDKVDSNKSFAEVWKSDAYARFRRAARRLPAPSDELDRCPCDNCQLRSRNISFHNALHPWNKIQGGPDGQLFTISDVLRGRKQRSTEK